MKNIIIIVLLLAGGICMAKELESLDEHNAKRIKEFQEFMSETPCGIACPKCGNELLANNSIVLTSNPSQTPVRCEKCGYKGLKH